MIQIYEISKLKYITFRSQTQNILRYILVCDVICKNVPYGRRNVVGPDQTLWVISGILSGL